MREKISLKSEELFEHFLRLHAFHITIHQTQTVTCPSYIYSRYETFSSCDHAKEVKQI